MPDTSGSEETRFEFGENWRRFLEVLDDDRIRVAEESLKAMLGVDSLTGKSFLDIGSGSGLFSLSAMRLGAERVHSFDFDPSSVNCALELKRRYFPDEDRWTIERGEVIGMLSTRGESSITPVTCGRPCATLPTWLGPAPGSSSAFTTTREGRLADGRSSSRSITLVPRAALPCSGLSFRPSRRSILPMTSCESGILLTPIVSTIAPVECLAFTTGLTGSVVIHSKLRSPRKSLNCSEIVDSSWRK
jgi:hypothetical protein